VYRVVVGSTSTVQRDVCVAQYYVRKSTAMWVFKCFDYFPVYLFATDTMVPVRFTLCDLNVVLGVYGGALWEQSAHAPHFQEALRKNRMPSLWNHIGTNSEVQMPIHACDVDGLDVGAQTAFVVGVGVCGTSHGARLSRCRDVDTAEIDFCVWSAHATLHCYADGGDPPVCLWMMLLCTHGNEFWGCWRTENTVVGGIEDRSAHKMRMFVEKCVVVNPRT